MGVMFSRIFDGFFGKREVRILMVGLDAAGKTTILYKLKLGEIVTTIPTIGFNVETVEYKNVKFTVWDIRGQTTIRPLWRYYFQNTQVLRQTGATDEIKDLLRHQVSSLLMSHRKTHSLLRDEEKALRELKADTEIVILPADKGRSTVILDKVDYRRKALLLLNDRESYKVSDASSLKSLVAKFNRILARLKKDKIITVKDCCGSCNCVGETGRRLQTRMHEHKLAVRRLDPKSEVATHAAQMGHIFNFDAIEIVGRGSDYTARQVQEAWMSIDRSVNRHINLPPPYLTLRTFLAGDSHGAGQSGPSVITAADGGDSGHGDMRVGCSHTGGIGGPRIGQRAP
nr:unnamed protein product [Spirometra erinaceieuropaei]